MTMSSVIEANQHQMDDNKVGRTWCRVSPSKLHCSCDCYHSDNREIFDKNLKVPKEFIGLIQEKTRILTRRQNGDSLKNAAVNFSNLGVNMCGSRGTKDVQALMATICLHLRYLPTSNLSLPMRDCLVYFVQLPIPAETPKASKSPKHSKAASCARSS
eukprot:TRINITY_DN1697_c2_g1_i2.p1 TRINITY_DN1697_c2_g1~~TRINITY_DN1697_c2_g1_i2.p1  ORF type:complete len:158 (+),score=18.65 TRINITY_DN1697_c2_g1_i2:72-545(+)